LEGDLGIERHGQILGDINAGIIHFTAFLYDIFIIYLSHNKAEPTI
jgi:hypothetical protein